MYANMPIMTMKKGERVRWYLVTMGEFGNFHTPHWHGNVVLHDGRRTDVILRPRRWRQSTWFPMILAPGCTTATSTNICRPA